MNLNKDTKTPGGGTTGFSTNVNAINRWALNATYPAELDNVCTTFINPFSENELVCTSNGVLPSEKIKNDLLNAENLGSEALDIFISTRWDKNGEAVGNNFFIPIKQLKFHTFSNLKSNISIKLKDKEISLNSQMNLFGELAIIMQTRQINLKDVFVIHKAFIHFHWLQTLALYA